MIESRDADDRRLGVLPLKPLRGGLAPWAKRRTVEVMRARLSEDVSVEELAVEVRLSRFHFARMFKQSFGVPPHVYLTRLRLGKGCELLEMTDLPVTEIAHEVGYSSNQVFARVFIKHWHMSPSDYRRAVRDPFRSDDLAVTCWSGGGHHDPRGGLRVDVIYTALNHSTSRAACAVGK